ncbi:MAG: hypothetical protein Ta2D_02030 [Rickettsiales bacterium]|nr:MAG: hypothetical protein Ta2D_02030 [Rickettsiales bacterium]
MSDTSIQINPTLCNGDKEYHFKDIFNAQHKQNGNPQVAESIVNSISLDNNGVEAIVTLTNPLTNSTAPIKVPIKFLRPDLFNNNSHHVYSINDVPINRILDDYLANRLGKSSVVRGIDFDLSNNNYIVYTFNHKLNQSYPITIDSLNDFKPAISGKLNEDLKDLFKVHNAIQKQQPHPQPKLQPPQSPDASQNQPFKPKYITLHNSQGQIYFKNILNIFSNLPDSLKKNNKADILDYHICSISIDKEDKTATFKLVNQDGIPNKKAIYTLQEVPLAELKSDVFKDCSYYFEFDSNLKISDVLHTDVIGKTHLDSNRVQKISSPDSKVESITLDPFSHKISLRFEKDSIDIESEEYSGKDDVLFLQYDNQTFTDIGRKTFLPFCTDLTQLFNFLENNKRNATRFLNYPKIVKVIDNQPLTMDDLVSEEGKKTLNETVKSLMSSPIANMDIDDKEGKLRICVIDLKQNEIKNVNIPFYKLKQDENGKMGAQNILLNTATAYFPTVPTTGFFGVNRAGDLKYVIVSSLPGNDRMTAYLEPNGASNVLYDTLSDEAKEYYLPLMQKQIRFRDSVRLADFSKQRTHSQSNMKAKVSIEKELTDDFDITAEVEVLENDDLDIKPRINVYGKPNPLISAEIKVNEKNQYKQPQHRKGYNPQNSQYNGQDDDQSDEYGNPRPLFQRHYKTPNHLVEPRYHPSSDETETLQYPSHRSRIRYEDDEYPTYHTTMPLHHKRLVSPFYDYDPAIMNPFGYNPGLFAYDMGFADGMRYAPQPNMQGMGAGMGMGGGMGFGGMYGGGFLVGHPFLMSPFGYHAMPGVDYSQPPKFMGGFGAFGGGMGMGGFGGGMGMGGFGGFHQPANNMYASPFFAPQLPYSPFANPLDFQLFQEFQQFKQHPQFPPYPPIPPMINEEEIQRFQIAQQLSQQKLMEEFPWAKPFIAPAYPIEFAPRMELPPRERPELPQQKPAAIPSTHQQKVAQQQKQQQSSNISQTI